MRIFHTPFGEIEIHYRVDRAVNADGSRLRVRPTCFASYRASKK